MKQVTGNTKLVTKLALKAVSSIDGEASEVIWYQLKEEPDVAYGYFRQYLLMPVRDLGKLAKQLRMSRSAMGSYSARFKWLDRARAYDTWQGERELEQIRVQRELQEAKWQQRRDQQREAEWNLAQELIEKVKLMLQVPLMKQTVTDYITNIECETIDPDVLEQLDAKEADIVIIKKVIINEPVDWSAVDVARWFDIASKVARLATGMATDHKKVRVDVSKLTDEELARLADED